jgi:hypothetical protein
VTELQQSNLRDMAQVWTGGSMSPSKPVADRVAALIQSIETDTLDPGIRFDQIISDFTDEELMRLCSFFRERCQGWFGRSSSVRA